MRTTLGYHITFHPYGTWLPGDDRGWSERPGEPIHRAPHRSLEAFAREHLVGPPVFLCEAQRAIVDRSIVDVCAHRGWVLHALVVQTDHLHLVATAGVRPELMMNSLKSWATRRLREAEVLAEDAKVWARHGSTRYLDDERRVIAAIEYVVRQGGTRRA